jgi:hypothetical protein
MPVEKLDELGAKRLDLGIKGQLHDTPRLPGGGGSGFPPSTRPVLALSLPNTRARE